MTVDLWKHTRSSIVLQQEEEIRLAHFTCFCAQVALLLEEAPDLAPAMHLVVVLDNYGTERIAPRKGLATITTGAISSSTYGATISERIVRT